jgi:hypothetical protein
MRPSLPRSGTTTTPVAEPALDLGRYARIVPEFEHGQSRNSGFMRVDSLLPQINITKHRLSTTVL